MKALTLWRPWPWAIFRAGKDVENRSWIPPQEVIGERIAIHAGQKWDAEGAEAIWRICGQPPPMPAERYPLGIIGMVVVAGYTRGRDAEVDIDAVKPRWPETGPHVLGQWMASPWAFGPYCWLLRDPIELPEPIPCRGAQRLWEVPAEVEARILELSAPGTIRVPTATL